MIKKKNGQENPNNKISIKEFFTILLEEQNNRTNIRFDALDKAITLSREEMNRRLGDLNQLREEVMEDRDTLVRREFCDGKHDDLVGWRESMNKKVTILETRSITWTAAVGIFFLIISLVMKWIGRG